MDGKMKLPYEEGSVFVLPLRNEGFARGVVALRDAGRSLARCRSGVERIGPSPTLSGEIPYRKELGWFGTVIR